MASQRFLQTETRSKNNARVTTLEALEEICIPSCGQCFTLQSRGTAVQKGNEETWNERNKEQEWHENKWEGN